jgi:hypothetical protein
VAKGRCIVLNKDIIPIKYDEKLITFVSPFEIMIFFIVLLKNFHFEKCYNHVLELLLMIFFIQKFIEIT